MLKNSLYYILLFFILCVIVYTQIIQASYDIIDHDDLFFMFEYTQRSFFDYFFINAYHGRFITNTLAIFIGSILPLSLDIHPNYWIQTFGVGIKAIFIFTICYLLSLSLFVFNKKSNNYKNFFVCILTLLFYFLYQNRFYGYSQAILYMSFYGFTLPFIIYLFFWKKFMKYFCIDKLQKNNSRKEIIFLCVLSFLIGCSSEFFSFSSFCTLTILSIWMILKGYKDIFKYICFFLSMFLGLILYVSTLGFRDIASSKLWGWTNFKDWFLEVISCLSTTFINDFIYVSIIIIVLFIIISFLKIENKKRKILIVSLYILGVICFYLSMMFVRQDFLENYLYIVHFDIVVQVQIAFIFVILLQISMLLEYKYIGNIIIIILSCCLIYSTKENLKDTYDLIIKKDKQNYILKYSNSSLEYLLNRYKSEYILLENIKEGREIYNLDDFVNNELRPNCSDCVEYIETIYNLSYDTKEQNMNITSVDQLYDKFLNDGGKPLSQEELDKHNFNVLLKKYRKK